MNNDLLPHRVAILGVGLLGGSVGLALKRTRPDIEIVGLSRSEAKRKLAVETGAVDYAVDSIAAACESADVVVVAAPVDRIASMANEAIATAPDDCLVTDVGSTKASIVASVPHRNFVAAHPIAGSEKTGVVNATASLFDGKLVIITPDGTSDRAMVNRCVDFWRLTGSETIQLSPADHDRQLAAVSHVPHLASSLVARLMPAEAKGLVGSGWTDITRVAAGDPDMWTAICRENRLAIIEALDQMTADAGILRELLASGDSDGLAKWLAAGKAAKESTL